jgi:hypothetical protein
MNFSRTTPFIDQRQRGAVFIVMLVFLIMGAVTFLVSSLNSSAVQIKRDEVTAMALAQAKEALIGRAVADSSSPGSFPCPDTNDDGFAQSPVGPPGGNCPSYIGRLPWKSLGLPDLRDGYNEKLWYVLSPNFRDNVAANTINSNSKGILLVYDNSGITPITSEAVAIIFAPGNSIGAQQRDTANQNNAQNYLDVGPSSINNYTAAGPFIAANKTSIFNDRLMIIKASDIMPVVETRVAKELLAALISYQSANSHNYPHPANLTGCTSASCLSASTVCIGKIPATDATLAPLLPTWFTPNNWFDVIYYTAGTNSLTAGSAGSGTIGWGKNGKGYGGLSGTGTVAGTAVGSGTGCYATTLHVSVTSVQALFLMPGLASSGVTRTGLTSANLSQYFEDIENQNLNDLYVLPTSTSNDLLYTLP